MNPGDLIEIVHDEKRKVGLVTGPGSRESINIMFEFGELNFTLDQLKDKRVKIVKLFNLKR